MPSFLGLSALSGILGGIGGFGAGVGEAMTQQRAEELKRQALAIEQQKVDQQQAQFDVTQRDKYIQPGQQIDALSKELGVNLAGMPVAALPEVMKAVQAKQVRQDELTAGGQIATQWGNVFGDPNTVVGDTGPQRPVITDKVVGPLAGLLTSGGYKPSMAPAIENAMKYVGEKELKAQERARDEAILSRFGLGPSAQPGGPPALGAPAADVDPAAMGVPQPVAAGGGIALPPGGGPAPEGGPAPARPGGGLAGYEQPSISLKVGPATIALKPRDITNEYSAAAFFGSNGRTTDLQALDPNERAEAQRLYQEGQTRNPDMLAASYLQSGDPRKVALAKGYQSIQREREAGNAAAVETSRIRATPPTDTQQAAILANSNTLAAIKQIKDFSPQEIGTYIGLFNKPKQEVLQALAGLNLVDANERYADFQTAVGRLRATAFESGGKALTPTEERVVYAYTVNGDERTAAQVVSKVRNLEGFTMAKRELLIELARTGRQDLDPASYDALLQQKLQAAGVRVPKEAPGWSNVPRTEAPKMGERGYTGLTTASPSGNARIPPKVPPGARYEEGQVISESGKYIWDGSQWRPR